MIILHSMSSGNFESWLVFEFCREQKGQTKSVDHYCSTVKSTNRKHFDNNLAEQNKSNLNEV